MMDFKLKPTKHYKSMEERVWTSLSGFSKSVDELSKGFSWEETCWPLGFWKKKVFLPHSCYVRKATWPNYTVHCIEGQNLWNWYMANILTVCRWGCVLSQELYFFMVLTYSLPGTILLFSSKWLLPIFTQELYFSKNNWRLENM